MTNTTDDVLNVMFIFVCAVLVFFMHTGFAMLEAGGVQVTAPVVITRGGECDFERVPTACMHVPIGQRGQHVRHF